jgi:hypothetical protein
MLILQQADRALLEKEKKKTEDPSEVEAVWKHCV